MKKKEFSFTYDKSQKKGKLKIGSKIIELSSKYNKGSSSMSYGLNLI